ncbi:penicillin-binding protein [Cellulomonas xiejunii]|uniref:Penicillin-binding protein n=1 Tax=Cellulomonas xiejunii TaxID=2968083 RepID=A0ABY5KS19_9CELL|nr:penicillin-binding protein [Cellulomonas xiejunii]MCC2313538.1 penicillin-binding protein [Cellulomonas xiejunii]MCC2321287.1 penicillin-binding protein [Cellulomonas xiejunii]UUI71875.1 penicillin-binding protein [Cellulomonas xiejunii]
MAASNRRAAPSRARRATRRPAASERRGFWNYPRREYTGLHRWLPSWRVVLGAFISGIFLALGAGAAAFAFIQPPDPLAEVEYQTTTVYYAGEQPGTPGEVMGRFADQRRELVDYESLPPHIGHAVAAGEDKTFFTNRGISLRAIGRAFLNNVQGKPTQGASTLTQQYVERYYQDTTTDYWGKAKEAILAIKISQNESKEMIMGRYLNTIYFGRDSYGIQAAAQSYFGVNAADLTVAQSAVLAAVIPSPNNWDPANNRAKAEQRWGIILDNMVEMGWLTSEERAAQVFPMPVEYLESETYRGPNGHLLKMVEKELLATKLWTEGELRTKGLSIITTIDKNIQTLAVESAGALTSGQLTDGATPNPLLRVSIVTIDPATGGIVALYGGPDYLVDSRNTSTYQPIQAGSTYKPFTLVAALEKGIGLGTTYDASSPQEFDIGEAKPWRVQNFANSSRYGTIDLVAATADSVNTVYAQLNLEVGAEETARVAAAAGATTEPTVVKSNVLGADTVQPADMANAYATFAAQGVHHDRHIVQAVMDADGAVSWSPDTSGEQVFAADVMADTTYALTQVVERGSGRQHVKPLGRPIAGKTGTSTDNKSAWFIGYVPQLATSVALYENGENNKDLNSISAWGGPDQITGGSHPAKLWAHYMKQVLAQPKYAQEMDFPPRANVGRTPAPTASAEPTPEATPEETQPPAEVQVPEGLVARTEADAVGALQAAGLTPRVVSERSATVPAGRVIRVEPGEGSTVASGATVTLVVSSGAPQPSPTPPPPPPTAEPTPAPTAPPEGGDAAAPQPPGQGQGQGG